MAILLPVLAFALLVPYVRRWQSNGSLRLGGWEGTLLIAGGLWGALLTLILEGLSWMSAIRQGPLVLAWAAVVGVLMARLVYSQKIGPMRLPRWPLLASGEWAFLGLVAVLAVGLLAVAWAAPPNNYDSLLYHMARVVHWAQNGSLDHYGTAYGHQLWNPPWAETAILNARVLWGNDRLSNLIQWSAYLGVLVGVSGLARLLELGRSGRWLAVAFAASLPMAVLQSTSTQNDLVTAFWLVTSAFLVLLHRRVGLGRLEVVALGAALGLGLLTKGTFYVLGLVVALWMAITSAWRSRPLPTLRTWIGVAAVVLALNAGHWSRNLAASGTPLGPAEWVGGHGTTTLASLKSNAALFPARLLRGLAPHFAGPWARWNQLIEDGVKSAYAAFGFDVNTPIVEWGWNHEDSAGNPIHLGLILVGVGVLMISPRGRRGPVVELAAVGWTGFLMTVLLISPAITPVGVRLQLPIFVLLAPVVAAAASVWGSERLRLVAAMVLVVAAFPWMFFNTTRPMIGIRADPGESGGDCLGAVGCTRIPSVFQAGSADVLFAGVKRLQRGMLGGAQRLEESSCRQVGLRIDSSDPEYPLWWLLEAPQSGFHLETIYTTPEMSHLLDREFQPCAIVCTICGGRTRLHGLPLAVESGPVKVFFGPGFTWDEDG